MLELLDELFEGLLSHERDLLDRLVYLCLDGERPCRLEHLNDWQLLLLYCQYCVDPKA